MAPVRPTVVPGKSAFAITIGFAARSVVTEDIGPRIFIRDVRSQGKFSDQNHPETARGKGNRVLQAGAGLGRYCAVRFPNKRGDRHGATIARASAGAFALMPSLL